MSVLGDWAIARAQEDKTALVLRLSKILGELLALEGTRGHECMGCNRYRVDDSPPPHSENCPVDICLNALDFHTLEMRDAARAELE